MIQPRRAHGHIVRTVNASLCRRINHAKPISYGYSLKVKQHERVCLLFAWRSSGHFFGSSHGAFVFNKTIRTLLQDQRQQFDLYPLSKRGLRRMSLYIVGSFSSGRQVHRLLVSLQDKTT